MVTTAARNLLSRPIAAAPRIGGALWIDFVNTTGGWSFPASPRRLKHPSTSPQIRDDRMLDYDDLLAWALAVSLIPAAAAQSLLQQAAAAPATALRELLRARALRSCLYRISFSLIAGQPPPADELARLSSEAQTCRAGDTLAADGGVLIWQPSVEAADLDFLIAPVVRSALETLTSPNAGRLAVCPGQDCGWLFLDLSRNRSRHWCDMKMCGNLAKVRSFRKRQAGE